MRYDLSKLFLTCYEGEGGDDGGGGDAGAAAAAAAAAKAGGKGGEGDVKNQAELNAALKREKDRFRQRDEARAKELEDMKGKLQLTEEQKVQFESQIEELRTAHMTESEKAKREADKLNKDWEAKHKAKEVEAQQWQGNYAKLKIGYEIGSASLKHKVIPQNVKFVESYLGPRTRLVEVKDEDGNSTGDFTAMVKFPDHTKEGKAIELDLPVPDAVKRMKELPDEFGYLFENENGGGVGGSSGQAGKKVKPGQMSTEEWIAARKKDRTGLLKSAG